MDVLEDLRMSLLDFNFVMIYIFHKIIKNHLNYLKDSVLNSSLTIIIDFY